MYKIDKIQKENKRMHVIGKVVSIIMYIILIPIIIFNFTLIIKSFIDSSETPDFFGYKSFVIVSGSMESAINKGDAIFVKEVPQNEIKNNDIISFKQDGEIITHRIVGITEEKEIKKYETKGDNNNTKDKEKVTYEQIEGKYIFKLNQFGVVTEILKNKSTLIILLIIIGLVYCYKSNIDNKKQMRQEKREKYEIKNGGKENEEKSEKR